MMMSWEMWQDPQTKHLWGQILGQLEIAAREFARFHSDWQYEVIRTEWTHRTWNCGGRALAWIAM